MNHLTLAAMALKRLEEHKATCERCRVRDWCAEFEAIERVFFAGLGAR